MKKIKRLLEVQGVSVNLPGIYEYIDADVVVAPLEGSPEESAYADTLRKYPGPIISDSDSIRALALALAYPDDRFNRLVLGVDPGRRCGFSCIGDDMVVYVGKVDCRGIGFAVKSLLERIPADRHEVYVGDGSGLETAAASFDANSIPYRVTDERGTSKTLMATKRILDVVKDRDIIASIAIALRGAYGVRYINKYIY